MKRTKAILTHDPDIRPLDQRTPYKRIKPGQKPEASEQLFFNPGESIEPDYDLESTVPEYIKKLKLSQEVLMKSKSRMHLTGNYTVKLL